MLDCGHFFSYFTVLLPEVEISKSYYLYDFKVYSSYNEAQYLISNLMNLLEINSNPQMKAIIIIKYIHSLNTLIKSEDLN